MRSSAGSWLDLEKGRFTGQEQSVLALLPGSCVLSPAAQGVHAPSPTQFLNCPATHGEHAVPFAPWFPSCRGERSQEMRVLPARCQRGRGREGERECVRERERERGRERGREGERERETRSSIGHRCGGPMNRLPLTDAPYIRPPSAGGWARRGRHRAAALFDLRAPPPADRGPGTLLLKPAGGELWSRPLRSGLLGLSRVSGFGFRVSGLGFRVENTLGKSSPHGYAALSSQ
jgi:hypothetical protein